MDCKGLTLNPKRVAQIEEAERLLRQALPNAELVSEVAPEQPYWADVDASAPQGETLEIVDISAFSEASRYAVDSQIGVGNDIAGIHLQYDRL